MNLERWTAAVDQPFARVIDRERVARRAIRVDESRVGS
jgi:hypothetical protein